MYQVKIMDTASEEHDILKTYEKAGFYVQGITISEDTIYLNRIQNNGTAYVDANQDMIRNRESDKANTVSITTAVSEEKETQVQIALADQWKEEKPEDPDTEGNHLRGEAGSIVKEGERNAPLLCLCEGNCDENERQCLRGCDCRK